MAGIITILLPFLRVLVDIIAYFTVFLLSADDVVVKGFLPYGETDLFRHIPLHLVNYRVDCRGAQCAPAVILNIQNHVYMVWHNNIFINPNARIDNRNIFNGCIYDLTNVGQY